MKVLVASKSAIKLKAVQSLYPQAIGVATTADLPVQPVNSGLLCAKKRLDELVKGQGDLFIAIENGIDTIDYFDNCGDNNHFVDVCYVAAEYKGMRYYAHSLGIPVEKRWLSIARDRSSPNYAHRDLGLDITIGQLLSEAYGVAADNWMADKRFGAVDRMDQILDALRKQPLRL